MGGREQGECGKVNVTDADATLNSMWIHGHMFSRPQGEMLLVHGPQASDTRSRIMTRSMVTQSQVLMAWMWKDTNPFAPLNPLRWSDKKPAADTLQEILNSNPGFRKPVRVYIYDKREREEIIESQAAFEGLCMTNQTPKVRPSVAEPRSTVLQSRVEQASPGRALKAAWSEADDAGASFAAALSVPNRVISEEQAQRPVEDRRADAMKRARRLIFHGDAFGAARMLESLEGELRANEADISDLKRKLATLQQQGELFLLMPKR